MDKKHKRKLFADPVWKILMIPILVLFSYLAVRVGIRMGDFMYEIHTGIIENVDTNSFKSTINASFPIIDTIYNSGKASVSFSGEIKNAIRTVFDFDLNSPLTILNVQSPLFLSYYNHEYKSMLADEGKIPPPETAKAPDNQAPDSQDPDNQAPDNGTNPGNNPGNNPGSNPENSGQPGTNTGKDSPPVQEDKPSQTPQLASSISLEPEDENENNGNIVSHNKIVIQNYTKFKIDIEKLLNEPLNIKFDKKGPQVLIYHTHTSESYVLKVEDQGKKGIPSFSTDPRYSVVRVGEELARNLKKYGFDVLHNGTVHDANRDAAYGVAIKTLQKYMKSYPSIKIYIDVHRDAIDSSKPKLDIVKTINGKKAAQVMFVVGTGETLPDPDWQENLKFVLKLQQKMNEKYPGLARPILVSSNRYNQHVSDGALLIEIGGDGNLLSDALESTKYVAEVLNDVINGN